MKNKRRPRKYSNRLSLILPILTIVNIVIITTMSSFYEESWTYDWSEIRAPIKDSIKIAEYRGITDGSGGMGRSTEKEVKRRLWIMNTATEEELLRLTKYPGGVIKAIAYEGLLLKKDFKQKTALLLEAIKDKKYIVYYQSGCLGFDMSLGTYLVDHVLHLNAPPSIKNDFGISTSDREKILEAYQQLKNHQAD